MGNKATTKSNETQTQKYDTQSQYDFKTAPDTADTSALRDMKFQIDPTIGYRASSAARRIGSQYSNALGPYSTASSRASMGRSAEMDLNQQSGEQFREGAFDANNQRLQQKMALAQMNRPQLVQTAQSGNQTGTNIGTSTTSSPWYNTIVNGAIQMGSAALG
jgi:hypothetical protein